MSRIAAPITLSAQERSTLDTWAHGRMAANGASSQAIARDLRVSRPTVQLWRQRFLALRLTGLEKDAPPPRTNRQNRATQDPSRGRSHAAHAVRLVAEPGGAILRVAHREGAQAGIAHEPPSASENPRVRRRAQRERQAFQLDQDRGRDPRQDAAVRPPHAAGARIVIGLLLGITDPGD